ncbi:MAG: TfoX/Sxy family protein [Massiliimalia sp.]|jgi:TfoX/Sxy family transcriptional regulator of competence genes
MATSQDYLNFLLDQLSSLEGITYRMMMGEYLIYYRGKVVAYVCDDRFLVKPVPSTIKLLPYAEYDSINAGGRKKLLRVDNVDDSNFLAELLDSMYDELPFPKSKKKT